MQMVNKQMEDSVDADNDDVDDDMGVSIQKPNAVKSQAVKTMKCEPTTESKLNSFEQQSDIQAVKEKD